MVGDRDPLFTSLSDRNKDQRLNRITQAPERKIDALLVSVK